MGMSYILDLTSKYDSKIMRDTLLAAALTPSCTKRTIFVARFLPPSLTFAFWIDSKLIEKRVIIFWQLAPKTLKLRAC